MHTEGRESELLIALASERERCREMQKERDEARALAETWVRREAAGVERGIRADTDALSEIQGLQAALANANGEVAHLTTLREKLDAELVWTRKSLAAANARAEKAEAERDLAVRVADGKAAELMEALAALAAARRECDAAFENGRTAGLEEAARDHLDGILTPEDEHLNFKRREFRRHAYRRFYERGQRDAQQEIKTLKAWIGNAPHIDPRCYRDSGICVCGRRAALAAPAAAAGEEK